jgi:hypothetical protein
MYSLTWGFEILTTSQASTPLNRAGLRPSARSLFQANTQDLESYGKKEDKQDKETKKGDSASGHIEAISVHSMYQPKSKCAGRPPYPA